MAPAVALLFSVIACHDVHMVKSDWLTVFPSTQSVATKTRTAALDKQEGSAISSTSCCHSKHLLFLDGLSIQLQAKAMLDRSQLTHATKLVLTDKSINMVMT